MTYPDFIQNFPALDLPFSEDIIQSRAVRSDAGLVVFFTFLQDFDLPEHAHLAQGGLLVSGEIELTIGGQAKSYRPGETWNIPAGVPHSARIKAGTCLMDVFEEPDRYPLKAATT